MTTRRTKRDIEYELTEAKGVVSRLEAEMNGPSPGLHVHRFKDNPEEMRFAEAWANQNDHGLTLAHLLDPRPMQTCLPPEPDNRDHVVAATVIQWLGSPVGQYFLQELGYELSKA